MRLTGTKEFWDFLFRDKSFSLAKIMYVHGTTIFLYLNIITAEPILKVVQFFLFYQASAMRIACLPCT